MHTWDLIISLSQYLQKGSLSVEAETVAILKQEINKNNQIQNKTQFIQYFQHYRAGLLKMQYNRRSKIKIQQISFVLQNIFIIHPTVGSKYKIRVIVNRNNRQHQFKKIKNKYIFQMPIDSEEISKNTCFLSLLQRSQKSGAQGQYLEIGKGEVELSDLLDPHSGGPVVNGVIYGTRSFNYDKIIGKYSYKISKERTGSNNKESRTESRTVNFSHVKKKDKPPEFAFKKAMIEHSNQINSKIKQLTKSMNQVLAKQKDEEGMQHHNHDSNRLLPTIRQNVFEDGDFYYKYNTKIEEQMRQAANSKLFKVLVIKNIRVDQENSEERSNIVKSKLSLGSKITNKESRPVEILLIFYDLFQERKLRKRLLQVFVQINYNVDNRFLAHNWFYLPKTSRKILVEVAFIGDIYNRDRSLNGVLIPSVAKSRLIQFLDSSERERGIFVCQFQDCTGFDQEEMKSYKRQVNKFDKVLRKFNPEFSSFVKKIEPKTSTTEELSRLQSKPLDSSHNDTLYSNFHSKINHTTSKRARLKTEQSRMNFDLLTPSISRYRNNFSSDKRSVKDRTLSNIDYDSKSLRGYPSDSETMVKFKKQLMKEKQFQNWNTTYRLYLDSIQFNIYNVDMKSKKVLIRFEMNDHPETKKIQYKTESDVNPLHIEYKNKKKDDVLWIQLLLNKPNTTKYYKVGKGHRMVSELKNSSSPKVKIMLTTQSKINAYVILNVRMFREKDDDEKSQSFYYKEGFDREVSLVSSGSKKIDNISRFQNFQIVDLPLRDEQESSFAQHKVIKDELDISMNSERISSIRNDSMQEISQKMSEKPPSEVLQEQNYHNGQTIKRKL